MKASQRNTQGVVTVKTNPGGNLPDMEFWKYNWLFSIESQVRCLFQEKTERWTGKCYVKEKKTSERLHW